MDITQSTSKNKKAWLEQLDKAVSDTDKPTIWRLMDEANGAHHAHEALASMVSRRAYAVRGMNVFCEIFLMPVLMQGSDLINNSAAWMSMRNPVHDALGVWFNDDGRITLFDDIIPLDWVTCWRPTVLRAHLDSLVPAMGRTKVRFDTAEIALPATAPKLGFVIIGRSTSRGWRPLPEAKVLLDNRLKDVVKYCVQIHSAAQSVAQSFTPIVLTPERIQYSITDGVCLWLSKLHEVVGIQAWTVMPSLSARDVVKFTLKLNSRQVENTQFILRMHQIGEQGLSDVLTILQQVAPMFDKPLDLRKDRSEKNGEQDLDSD